MMRLFVILLLSSSSLFAVNKNSAHRDQNVSYQKYKSSFYIQAQGSSVLDHARLYGQTNLAPVTTWESISKMNERFQAFRDVRWLQAETQPGFLRRSTWLYPDDGCYARASLAVMNLFHWHVDVPNKIFVFGDLNVKTANSPDGHVSWWYHVAPIVQVGSQKYVLDPAIHPQGPLKLEDWLGTMSSDIDHLEVAICGSGAYGPYDICDADTDGIEKRASDEQLFFLENEWQRLVELQRDPNNELGANPPW